MKTFEEFLTQKELEHASFDFYWYKLVSNDYTDHFCDATEITEEKGNIE